MNSQNFGPGDNRALPIKEALADLPADEKKSTLQRWRDSLKKLAGATSPGPKTPDGSAPRQLLVGVNALGVLGVWPGTREFKVCAVCNGPMERVPDSDPPLFGCPYCGFFATEAGLAEPPASIIAHECPNCGYHFGLDPRPDRAVPNCPRCGLMIAAFETFKQEQAMLEDRQTKDARDFMAAVLPPKMLKRRLAQALHALDTAIERLEEVKRHEIETGQWPGKALNTMLEDLDGERERLFGYAERRYKVKKSVLRAYR